MINREPKSTDYHCVFCEEYFEWFSDFQEHGKNCEEAKKYGGDEE